MTKILIVEDNDVNRDVLGRLLSRKGFDVLFAVDGPSGIEMTAAHLPDVVLMDVALGDMDGWEATRQIRDNPATADTPIIAVTAHALESERVKSVEVGCNDFDTKPIVMARLLKKIEACLNGKPKQNQYSIEGGR